MTRLGLLSGWTQWSWRRFPASGTLGCFDVPRGKAAMATGDAPSAHPACSPPPEPTGQQHCQGHLSQGQPGCLPALSLLIPMHWSSSCANGLSLVPPDALGALSQLPLSCPAQQLCQGSWKFPAAFHRAALGSHHASGSTIDPLVLHVLAPSP